MATIIENGQPPPIISIERVEVVVDPGGTAATSAPSTGISDYVHNQPTPSASWIINHNLGRVVTVTLYTTGSVEMIAEVIPVTLNQAVASFDQPTAGYARVI